MLNFKDLPPEEKKNLANAMFQPLNSADELKDWIYTFFDLDMPNGHLDDPDSNSSPIEAMWEIYSCVKENKGEENPGYIMLSAREGYKTLSASILETLLILHFRLTIAHLAAIQAQSAKAIQYINQFFNKVEPLLEVAGWTKTSENKSRISYRTQDGYEVYIRVIVATMAGANSEHTNMMFVDEIDVVQNPQAYEEAKLIPGYDGRNGRYPITVKLSTRKFAFGLMQKEIDLAPISGDKILRWNLLDVTQACPPSRHKPNEPKVDRFINKALPLRQLTQEEYDDLQESEKDKWQKMAGVHAGCATCKLLPVCKTRLASRPADATGGLFKPIGAVINTFKKTNPDMAEAQLMCWKPSTKGMVYPRFESTINSGNVITLERAWETLVGDPPMKKHITEADIVWKMKQLGIQFYAGVDWGYTHDFVIVVFALIPNGEVWIVDCYSMSGLEFSDILEIAKTYRDKYNMNKWFCDQALPANIKSFNKNHMKSPAFTKDVMGGIEALRSKIIDGNSRRLLKIFNTEACEKVKTAFQKHHFKLDSAGNPSLIPDDTPGIADSADAMRYVGQNLFPIRGTQKPNVANEAGSGGQAQAQSQENTDLMKNEILSRLGGENLKGGNGKKAGFTGIFRLEPILIGVTYKEVS